MTQSIFPMNELDVDREQEPRVVSFKEADDVIEALASQTARTIVDLVSEEPMSSSELATAADTSVQNVSYHLERLVGAGLVEVVGTSYSSRGVEMDMYAPVSGSVVICLGDEQSDTTVSRAVQSNPNDSAGLVGSD